MKGLHNLCLCLRAYYYVIKLKWRWLVMCQDIKTIFVIILPCPFRLRPFIDYWYISWALMWLKIHFYMQIFCHIVDYFYISNRRINKYICTYILYIIFIITRCINNIVSSEPVSFYSWNKIYNRVKISNNNTMFKKYL